MEKICFIGGCVKPVEYKGLCEDCMNYLYNNIANNSQAQINEEVIFNVRKNAGKDNWEYSQ